MKKALTKNVIVLAISMGLLTSPLHMNGQTVGEKGPDFEVTLLDGSTFKLSDQMGKVVFVFFFGNNCSACKGAAPSVESMVYQEYMDNENFLAIGLDTWNSSSSVSTVTAFKSSTGVSFPLGLMANDVAKAYSSTYDRLMVIDQEGILRFNGQQGAKNDISSAVQAIDEALTVMGVDFNRGDDPGLKVYPVPARDQLYFESEEGIQQVRLFDVSGKMVRNVNFNSSSALLRSVSLDGLQRGMYFYRTETGSGSITGKFMVQ